MFRTDLIARAISEWNSFGQDIGRMDKYVNANDETTLDKMPDGHRNPRKETVDPYASRVADYWLAIETNDYKRLVKNYAKEKGGLDGTIDLAWSAAFISYCMQLAGAGTAFHIRLGMLDGS